ncbi:MAG: hypothetical protein HY872_14130 [Chloroflexi bacterium]|nr:hypothetical protein [Chloroflexota bacterium]MBI5828248.1 hypothetical protein [Chloroflexota bacterium]
MKVIIDFDGTLTAEETQVQALSEKALNTLAHEIIGAPLEQLRADYAATRARLLQAPHLHGWRVNGLLASYCDEGAFILNTSTLQAMLGENDSYRAAVNLRFADAEYDPVADCTNHLFHRHTAEIPPAFRPAAPGVLSQLLDDPERTPVILTNSRADKVLGQLAVLGFERAVPVLGDTRQYDMDPAWEQAFAHPHLGGIQVWPIAGNYAVDLRRPAYHRALVAARAEEPRVAVVADTFSLPGALPLMMGIPFLLLRTVYTPQWCAEAVAAHPLGRVLDDLAELPAVLDTLPLW